MNNVSWIRVLLWNVLSIHILAKNSSVDQSQQLTNSSSAHEPVAVTCGPSTAKTVCINRYGSLLPPSFERDIDATSGYSSTKVPDDPSWALVSKANFVIFDKERGLQILGRTPKIQPKYFDVLSVVHEAPIYDPATQQLFITQDGPPGNITNLVIDLKVDPPTLKTFVTDPPVYQPTGGILHDGMIYWAVQGNNQSLPGGLKQRPGVVRVNPKTLKAEWLLNNYYGFAFSGPNDLTVDSFGDVWFTDSSKSCLSATIYQIPKLTMKQITESVSVFPNLPTPPSNSQPTAFVPPPAKSS